MEIRRGGSVYQCTLVLGGALVNSLLASLFDAGKIVPNGKSPWLAMKLGEGLHSWNWRAVKWEDD